MKIFAIADIHGDSRFIENSAKLISDADVVVIAGDITKTGKAEKAEKIIGIIEQYNASILAVHGNWDRVDVLDFLEEKGYSLHAFGKVVNDVGFFGVGGSIETMMKTETEYNEEEIYEFLKYGYNSVKHCKKIVLVTHNPPKGVKDKTYLKLKGGSSSIRDFINEMNVDVCICGHIHEAWGTETYGNCAVLNTGSFKKGRYGVITINDHISIETNKFKRKWI